MPSCVSSQSTVRPLPARRISMQSEKRERHAERHQGLDVGKVLRVEWRKGKCQSCNKCRDRRTRQLAHQREGRDAIQGKAQKKHDVIGEYGIAGCPDHRRRDRVRAQQVFSEGGDAGERRE